MFKCIECQNYLGNSNCKVSPYSLECTKFLAKSQTPDHWSVNTAAKIRTFDTGATRDTDKDKLDYEGFLSPLVLERYARYLHKHRTQSDGQLRDSDNWQKMFGEKHFDVCIKSTLRHVIDVWKQHRGYKGEQSIEDSICAILFNMQAYLFKILKAKHEQIQTPRGKENA